MLVPAHGLIYKIVVVNLITIFENNIAIFGAFNVCPIFYFCCSNFETKFNIQFDLFEVYNFFLESFVLNSF